MVPELSEDISMVNPIKFSRSATPAKPKEFSFLVTPPWPLSLIVIKSGVNLIEITEQLAWRFAFKTNSLIARNNSNLISDLTSIWPSISNLISDPDSKISSCSVNCCRNGLLLFPLSS